MKNIRICRYDFDRFPKDHDARLQLNDYVDFVFVFAFYTILPNFCCL